MTFFETFRRFSVSKRETTSCWYFHSLRSRFLVFSSKSKSVAGFIANFSWKFCERVKKSEGLTALVKMACDEATVTVSFTWKIVKMSNTKISLFFYHVEIVLKSFLQKWLKFWNFVKTISKFQFIISRKNNQIPVKSVKLLMNLGMYCDLTKFL